jgi:cation/acetate symporter
MTLAFAATWLISLIDRSRTADQERKAYEAQYIRSQTGIGAEGASAH